MKKTTRISALFLVFALLMNLSGAAFATTEGIPLEDLDITMYEMLTKTSLTLDFLPAGLTAEDESVTGTTAVIVTNPVPLYKSLDNGAEAIEVEVESGTEIDLVTKYTFTTESGDLVFYRYDYWGSNEELSDAAFSERSGYVFVYSGDILVGGEGSSGENEDSGSADTEETTGIDLTEVYGAYVSSEELAGYALINSDAIRVYGEVNTETTGYIDYSEYNGTAIQLTQKVAYENGNLYQFSYTGEADLVSGYYIDENDIIITCCAECTAAEDCGCDCECCAEAESATLTLDFLPEGLYAEGETAEITSAVIVTNPVPLYKSLDNGAEGIAVTVESGTEIELVTKYTFETDSGLLVFYRYDYNGSNEALGNAAISESSGYPFIYSGDISLTETEKTDEDTGVGISAALPADVTLTVESTTLEDSGIDTTVYPIGGVSLFFDVTLYQDGAEYQPENGITVTFPEDAIAESGLEVGDYYKVYHIHDGITDVTGPFLYNGGAIEAKFDNLSVVGVAETESVSLAKHGSYVKEYLDYYVAEFADDDVTLYGSYEDDYTTSNVATFNVTNAAGTCIELSQKYTYEDGFILYFYQYDGTDDTLIDATNNYPFISSEDVNIICSCGCYNCTGAAGCACCDNCACVEEEVEWDGESESVEIEFTDSNAVRYQWYQSTDGETWTAIDGATASTLTIAVTVESMAMQYRCEALDAAGNLISYKENITLLPEEMLTWLNGEDKPAGITVEIMGLAKKVIDEGQVALADAIGITGASELIWIYGAKVLATIDENGQVIDARYYIPVARVVGGMIYPLDEAETTETTDETTTA